MKALAFIPCKLTSERLARKNLLPVGGVPMVRRAVDVAVQAKALGLVGRIVVITTAPWVPGVSNELGAILKDSGCELVGRPDSNARQVLREWLESLPDGERPDLICQLLPTSPLRTLRHVVESRLLLTEGVEVVMSVTPFRQDVRYAVQTIDGRVLRLDSAEWATFPIYKHDGQVLWSRTSYVLSDEFPREGWYAHKTVAYHVPPEESADIDDELGLYIAECLLRRREGT